MACQGEGEIIFVPEKLADDLVQLCVEALPRQAYGLVGGRDRHHPQDIYPCLSNLRNTPKWRRVFDSFGDFYKEPDRGFVLSPEEQLGVLEKMRLRRQTPVGVFHSHRIYPPVPTRADLALHNDPELLCYIISVTDPEHPELRIYHVEGNRPHQETVLRLV